MVRAVTVRVVYTVPLVGGDDDWARAPVARAKTTAEYFMLTVLEFKRVWWSKMTE